MRRLLLRRAYLQDLNSRSGYVTAASWESVPEDVLQVCEATSTLFTTDQDAVWEGIDAERIGSGLVTG